MRCDQRRIEESLHGDLSDADEAAFDEHLLVCEACWQAVQEDRAGRLALERLRVSAPLSLADRLAAAVDLSSKQPPGADADPDRHHGAENRVIRRGVEEMGARRHRFGRPQGRSRSHPSRRLVVAAASVVALIGTSLGWVLSEGSTNDPPQIARVVTMDSPTAANSPALRSGEHFDFGGQSLEVRSYRVEGITTLVATSDRPFPMPASSHLLAGSSSTAWMATHGKLALYGVNRPAGDARRSMFIVAAMPMARLPQVAASLHLI